MALVTAERRGAVRLHNRLLRLLTESDVTEVSWKTVRTAKRYFAAEKLVESIVEAAAAWSLRVDVLVWDIRDSRHDVAGRDDRANLERMYFQLFRNVLDRRWPDDAVWALYPDHRHDLEWETSGEILESVSTRTEISYDPFSEGGDLVLRLRRSFKLAKIEPQSSESLPLTQTADLFAGLAAFSHEQFDRYLAWSHSVEDGGDAYGPVSLSASERVRYQLLHNFFVECSERSLGVTLSQRRGLWTPNPGSPINFWRYSPRRADDRAPTRR